MKIEIDVLCRSVWRLLFNRGTNPSVCFSFQKYSVSNTASVDSLLAQIGTHFKEFVPIPLVHRSVETHNLIKGEQPSFFLGGGVPLQREHTQVKTKLLIF